MATLRILLSVFLGGSAFILPAQFVAFNDHDGGEGQAHPFTTRYSLFYASQSNVVQGPLRDISDGSLLPVELRIEGPVFSPFPTTNFVSGTPASMIFGCSDSAACIVDFRGSSPRLAGTNWYTFTGLNSARKYQFIGTANISGFAPTELTRTLYAIHGVDSFVSAHTSNCITQYSTLMSSNEVAVPTGRNAQPGFGDMVVWNDIRVGADGSFSVTASRFFSDSPAMPFGGLRLVEDFVEPTAPFVAKQPKSVNASRASNQSLAPTVSGSLPLLFQWFKDGAPLATGTNRTLRFTSLQPEDAGAYWLVTTNPYGTITTSNVTVTVGNDPIGIVGQPTNRPLHYGDPLLLSVSVTGTPPHFFQWFKDGAPLANAQSNLFFLGAARLEDAGAYSVLASNLFSSATSATAIVTVVQTPLRITEQPQSAIVTQGTTLRLQVAVAGSAPQFRWFRNGTAIANGTSSVYRVTSATTNNGGNYYVVATAPMNAVTSAVAVMTVVSPAPPTNFPGLFSLLRFTNVWAYDQSGRDLGSAWRENGFDDSGWPVGRGIFAFENTGAAIALSNTVLRLTTGSGQPIITSYFRTRFHWPTSAIGASLLFSNLIDDGAIFYLNGVELFRQNMSEGNISGSTLAPTPSLESLFVVTNALTPVMVEDDNVLAVEVHQNSPTSSDIVFGTSVFGYNVPDTPLSIVASPINQTVAEAQAFELHFRVNTPARFQWYHNGNPVSAARAATYFIPVAHPADAGQYFAVASNSLGSITSAVVIVQVVADTQAPRVLSAVLQTNRSQVIIQFDEPLRQLGLGASDLGDYEVLFSDGTEAAPVTSVSYSNTEVRLVLSSPLPPETNLVLWLNRITDTSAATNQLTNYRITLRQVFPLVPIEGVWKYNDAGNDLGASWRESNYDDSAWQMGAALFYNDNNWLSGPNDFPPPVANTNTLIQLTNDGIEILTHYFRARVDFTPSPLSAQLSLRTVIDDGAVLYWNGAEFFRLGMPDGAISATNLASRVRGTTAEGTFEGPFVFSLTNVVTGENVLAAEVHQGNPANNADVSFGIEVSAFVKSFPNEPARIVREPSDLSVAEGQAFSVTVDSVAATHAQWLRNGSPISGATREVLTMPRATLGDDGARYAVILSNAFSSVTSSNVTLHVVADTNPPVLLAANAYQSLTEITLTFSEPIDSDSILDLAHYSVRAGNESVAVTGATLINETNVVLTTAARVAGRNYEVRVGGVRDAASAGNEIEPGSGAMPGYEFVLVPLTAMWTYDQSGNGQVDGWKTAAFDDSDWLTGQALLYNDTFTTLPAAPLGTLLSQTNAAGAPVVTHYFRHVFDLPPLEEGAALSIRHAVDDGVVIYLNGSPILRTNVPAGAIDATTIATTTVGDAVLSGAVSLVPGSASGVSVLAAETHQVNSTLGSDVAFATELSITRTSSALPPAGPVLRITRVGTQLQLSWNATNYLLESAGSVDGVWTPIQPASSPLLIQSNEAARFYRLHRP
jgi:hypothetical protein